MTLLTVKNLSKQYGTDFAVNNVNFDLQNNTCVALIGPNGAGKTTTLRILTGLIKQTTGNIQFKKGANIDFRSHIGYLPQYPVFHNWMTGKQFLIYCAKLAHIEKNEANQRAEELLKRVGISAAKNKRVGTYSGGMKQRLGIAQAIIHQPTLLILDEPVSALDPIGRRDVLTLMEDLKKEMTILFSTHILGDADEISDELILLHKGQLIESGSIEQLRKKYQTAMIELKFETNDTLYMEQLAALDSVIEVTKPRNTLHVQVTDLASGRLEILKLATSLNWPLLDFSINKASLEDMFMKAVK